eukprot:jgi/Tetstr1/460277/TSEL_005577.t1
MVVGGAPPGILEDVATAAADKVRHAAASLQVARLLRGGAQSAKAPDRLPQQLGAPRSLRDLAAAVLQEGCLEETAVRAIEGEESTHALLAWRTLVWALRSPASAAEGVREVVAAGLRDAKGMVDAPRP